MECSRVELGEKVRRKAASMGARGLSWIDGLPCYVAEIERRWKIKVGRPYGRGTEAFVAEAVTADGQEAVLKIVIPGLDPARREIGVLRAADGRGYVRLLRADDTDNVMLLERLGSQLSELGLPAYRQIEIICAALKQAWFFYPEAGTFNTGAEIATALARSIELSWNQLGKPCPEPTVDLALAYAERRRRAFDPARSVLVHGDAHQWNTLSAGPDTAQFKLIDPDGGLAERAFDLSIPMREWAEALPAGDLLRLGRERCALLARLAGVDPQPIWEWSLIQCVSNGLSLLQIGLDGPGSMQLTLANAWTEPAP